MRTRIFIAVAFIAGVFLPAVCPCASAKAAGLTCSSARLQTAAELQKLAAREPLRSREIACALYELGRRKAESGERSEAMALFGRAANQGVDRDLTFNAEARAASLSEMEFLAALGPWMKDRASAERRDGLRLAAGRFPRMADAHYWLAKSLAASGDGAAAATEMAEALILDPGYLPTAKRALFRESQLDGKKDRGLSVRTAGAPGSGIRLGTEIEVETLVSNGTQDRVWKNVEAEAQEPEGFGLLIRPGRQKIGRLGPGETVRLTWRVRGQRPNGANLGRPWEAGWKVSAEGAEADRFADFFDVYDPEPGIFYYTLTEDSETFDAGPETGAYGASRMGNRNNWMDPEEHNYQMALKVEALNQIADRHGAKWTHFWAVPQRFGVEWALRRSKSPQWAETGEALDEHIRKESQRHEYAMHLHCDYDPRVSLPPRGPDGERLRYDPETNGILPVDYYDPVSNPSHQWHDWDGGMRNGLDYFPGRFDPNDGGAKAGSVLDYQAYLGLLQRGRRYPIVERVGSFDFGLGPTREEESSRAFLNAGVLATSDRDRSFDMPYFSRIDDVDAPAVRPAEAGGMIVPGVGV